MKLYHFVVAVLIAACSPSVSAPVVAKSEVVKTSWIIIVESATSKRNFKVSPAGGRVPGTGSLLCQQAPPIITNEGIEEVSVSCGLPNKSAGNLLTLFSKCEITKPDNNVSQMMAYETSGNWLLTIACVTK